MKDEDEEQEEDGMQRNSKGWVKEAERRIKQQNLILYNFSEEYEEALAFTFGETLVDKPKRLGQSHTASSKARPLRLTFTTRF